MYLTNQIGYMFSYRHCKGRYTNLHLLISYI